MRQVFLVSSVKWGNHASLAPDGHQHVASLELGHAREQIIYYGF